MLAVGTPNKLLYNAICYWILNRLDYMSRKPPQFLSVLEQSERKTHTGLYISSVHDTAASCVIYEGLP